jgi:hypothetical protein
MPLAWPGSTRKKSEGPVNPNELTFRDGVREVAPYLAVLMGGLDTVRYTYEDAVAEVNRRMTADHVNGAVERALQDHFSEGRR